MKHMLRTTLTIVVLASLAMTAAANSTHKHKTKKHATAKAAPIALAATPAPAMLGPMVGTWTLRDGDKPRTDIKMVFRKDGTFAFIGPNWKSNGTFHVQEHLLSLEWASIDGSKVAPGTVKKDFAMGEDDGSFKIDTYTYYKLEK